MMNATRTTAVKRSWKIKRWKLKRAQFLLEKRRNEGFIKVMNIISLNNQMKKNFDHLNTNPNCPPPPSLQPRINDVHSNNVLYYFEFVPVS